MLCVTFPRQLWRRRQTPPCATSSTFTGETPGSTRLSERARGSRAWSRSGRWHPALPASVARPWASLASVSVTHVLHFVSGFQLSPSNSSLCGFFFFTPFLCPPFCVFISSHHSVCLLFSCPDKVIFLSSARPTDYLKVVCFASLRAGFLFSATLFSHPTALTLTIISPLFSRPLLSSLPLSVLLCCPLTRCPAAIRPLMADCFLPACVSLPAPVLMLIVCVCASFSASVGLTEALSPHKPFTDCHLISVATYTNTHTTSAPYRSLTAS